MCQVFICNIQPFCKLQSKIRKVFNSVTNVYYGRRLLGLDTPADCVDNAKKTVNIHKYPSKEKNLIDDLKMKILKEL